MGIKQQLLNQWQKIKPTNQSDSSESSTENKADTSAKDQKQSNRLATWKNNLFNRVKAVSTQLNRQTASPSSITNQVWQRLTNQGKNSQAASSENSKLKIPNSNKIKSLLTKWNSQDEIENQTVAKIELDLEKQDQSRVKRVFHRFLEKVKPEDIETINQNLDKMRRGPIKDIWYKVVDLANIVRDPKVAWRSKAIAIATLVYLVSPFDAIPDVIPFAGLADDAALIMAVVSTLAYELENYLVRQAEKQAEIQVKKYNKIVRIALLGSITAAVLAIIVKYTLNHL